MRYPSFCVALNRRPTGQEHALVGAKVQASRRKRTSFTLKVIRMKVPKVTKDVLPLQLPIDTRNAIPKL